MKINKKELPRKILKYSLIFLACAFTLSLFLALLVYAGAFGRIPGKETLKNIPNEEASLVYSSDSVLIGKFFAENRTNISWKQIPAHLKNALIATEDKRFFSHKGYDSRSYLRVLLRTVFMGDESGGGGSTITQQLVKNLYGRKSYGLLTIPVNKIKEIILASRFEKVYSKEEILLLYLNSVPFGEDVYGVESAAQRYFNKPAGKLRIEESAVLVGMLKANTYYNPQLNPENSRLRRNQVLALMVKEDYLPQKKADSLQKLPLKLNYENFNLNAPAGYFVYQVKKKTQELLSAIKDQTGKEYNLETDGLRIYTTLNMRIQRFSSEAVKKHLTVMQKLLDKELANRKIKARWTKEQKLQSKNSKEDTQKRNVLLFDWNGIQTKNINRLDSLWHYYKMLNASVLVTNPKNGAVLTWVGGNDFRFLPFDMVLSHRQIASAFKPVLFATALETGIEPCEYLENAENKYPGYEDWEPHNYDREATPDSTVAFWYALAHSMNLPTVDLYFKVGSENLQNTCNKLHFPGFVSEAPSNALGSLDVSLYEIVRAYGTFANQGQLTDLVMINKITDTKGNILYKRVSADKESVFSPETCEKITAILQETINQGTGAGIRSQYGIQSDLAGKTGTAQNYSNAWFIAYTPDMVIGTWVGNSMPDIHFNSSNGSGSALALPVVANVIRNMEKNPLLRKKYLTSFSIPAETYSFLECEPFHNKGIDGFFSRLFRGKSADEKDTLTSEKNEEEKKGVKSFFRRIFKGER